MTRAGERVHGGLGRRDGNDIGCRRDRGFSLLARAALHDLVLRL